MHVTPSLKQSYVLACDLPIPAWNYVGRGHQVTIAIDNEAVTAFSRDSDGRTALDRLDILPEDLDELADMLEVPLPSTPRTYGDLFRFLVKRGVRMYANQEALDVQKIPASRMDPLVMIVSGQEFKRILSDADAFLPYDDLAVPHHSLFHTSH